MADSFIPACPADTDTNLFYAALQTLPGLGPRREARLFTHFHSLANLLGAGPAGWRAARLAPDTCAALAELRHHGSASRWCDAVQEQLARCAAAGWQLLSQESPHYPPLLRETDLPPPLLYVWGNPDILLRPQLAMVGSRKASAAGLAVATELAGELSHAGLTITSGLALGVDSACHRAALASGRPTVAVLGSGLGRLYPLQNSALAAEIATSGCVVSEFPPDTAPQPGNFPQRNRIISGLSRGVVVIEAAIRSGSLITARLALEQNREVYAVPGSIRHNNSKGCNALIKSGARLITGADEIIEDLQQLLDPLPAVVELQSFSADAQQLATELAEVLQHVGFETTSIDQIVQHSGKPVAAISRALMQLQLYGRVEQQGGSYLRVR